MNEKLNVANCDAARTHSSGTRDDYLVFNNILISENSRNSINDAIAFAVIIILVFCVHHLDRMSGDFNVNFN